MKEDQNDIPRCGHYASSYLPLTENWIHRILTHQKKFKPVFLSRKKENLSLFPIENLYSLDDFQKVRQLLEILVFKIVGYFIFFRKICRKNNIQILHVHFGYHGVKMIGLKKTLGVPMICSFYGDDAFSHPLLRNMKNKYNLLFKAADKVLVLGPYMRSQLISLGCNEDKVLIHHLGIDIDKIPFKKRSRRANTPIRFLIASSFVEKKGIDLAIQALSKFKNSHSFSLDIVGDGPLKNELLALVEHCGIKDRVHWHGYKPYQYFIDLAYECDVFIQASRTTEGNRKEGTPMAIVDAMATGMTIIATKHSDIPEIVSDGVHGYLAEENSLASLQECILKLFNNPIVIESFDENSRNQIEKEFDVQRQVLKLETLYTELVQRYSSTKSA